MVTALDLYNNAKSLLKLSGIDNYRFEAALLVEKATGIKKHELPVKGAMLMSGELISFVGGMIDRRKNGEPLQYILGEWEFYGFDFKVGSGVLIPRQDTETLVDVVLERNKAESPVIADLCSGSGCIAVALDKKIKSARVFAVELSSEALPYLTKNIKINSSGVKIICGDVTEKETLGNIPMCDVIACNPPYLSRKDMSVIQKDVGFEPEIAFFGGDDGLDFYRIIAKLWAEKLRSGGVLAFEIGIGQQNAVSGLLAENGFKNIQIKNDLCSIARVVSGNK
ncbi:MAG: peptide chain release factor N(5)-glutamine methyltransferase [Oscillospiraceae bacterium]|jgi:release factor glutamine methyltransferase